MAGGRCGLCAREDRNRQTGCRNRYADENLRSSRYQLGPGLLGRSRSLKNHGNGRRYRWAEWTMGLRTVQRRMSSRLHGLPSNMRHRVRAESPSSLRFPRHARQTLAGYLSTLMLRHVDVIRTSHMRSRAPSQLKDELNGRVSPRLRSSRRSWAQGGRCISVENGHGQRGVARSVSSVHEHARRRDCLATGKNTLSQNETPSLRRGRSPGDGNFQLKSAGR